MSASRDFNSMDIYKSGGLRSHVFSISWEILVSTTLETLKKHKSCVLSSLSVSKEGTISSINDYRRFIAGSTHVSRISN